jgi:hypothetical protein
VLQIFQAIAVTFAAARAFQVHDPADATIDPRNVVSATGFQEDGEPIIAERFHEGDTIFLEQGFSAGQFDQWKVAILLPEWTGQPVHFCLDLGKCALLPFSKCVSSITIGTTQVAGGQADKDARQPRERALSLQAQVNLVDD